MCIFVVAMQWVWLWASWQWQNFTGCFLFLCHQTRKKTRNCTPISYSITRLWIRNWKETWHRMQTSVRHLLFAPWLSCCYLNPRQKIRFKMICSLVLWLLEKELKMQWWSLTNQSTFWANTTASLQCTTNMSAIFWRRPFAAVIWICTKIWVRVKQNLYSLTLLFF